jgi:hypothetical protein
LEAALFYVMDRGCMHFRRLYQFTLAAAFFVVRGRINMQHRRRTRLPGHDPQIRYVDPEQAHPLVFITKTSTCLP